MGVKNFFQRATRNLRVKTGYNIKPKGKDFYKTQLKKIIVSIVIVLVIILIKSINVQFTNKTIEIVDRVMNYTINFKEDGKKVLEYAKNITKVPEKIVSVFSSNDVADSQGYLWPIEGIVYQRFGEVVKPNNIKIFYKGIDIQGSKYDVCAISDGEIIEVGENNLQGKYIRINHEEFEAIYSNLINTEVTDGQMVNKGETIGYISKAENGILHFEIWKNGEPIDPLNVIGVDSYNAVSR